MSSGGSGYTAGDGALFFYGSLCHVPLLEIVLGRAVSDGALCAARLDGVRASWVQGKSFPMIERMAGARVQGLLLAGLSPAEVARLRFYEQGFDYDVERVVVQTVPGAEAAPVEAEVEAEVFFPKAGQYTAGAPWSVTDWAARWGAMHCDAAREIMGHFGADSDFDMKMLRPFLHARAWARQLAKTPAPARLRRNTTVDAVDLTPLAGGYAGFFRLDTFALSYPRYDGTTSAVVERGGFVAYDAALILPYDPKSDRVLVIEQLRYGPILRGDPRPWVFEPVAGLVDAGEAPMEAARREAVEEASLELSDIRPMMQLYASPGYSTEFFHYFLGITDLSLSDAGLGGLAEESEDIRSHVLSFDAAMALLDSGEINSAPLATMLLWLARVRDELRAEAGAGGLPKA